MQGIRWYCTAVEDEMRGRLCHADQLTLFQEHCSMPCLHSIHGCHLEVRTRAGDLVGGEPHEVLVGLLVGPDFCEGNWIGWHNIIIIMMTLLPR